MENNKDPIDDTSTRSLNKKKRKKQQEESLYNDNELNFDDREFKKTITNNTVLFDNLETLKDILVLDIKNILPDEIYVTNLYKCWIITALCTKIVEICERSITKGISENDIPTPQNTKNYSLYWSFDIICNKFDDIINTFRNFRISKYHFIYHYNGSGKSKKWNLVTHIFVCECYLLFCRQRFSYIIQDCPDNATLNWNLDLLNRLTNLNRVVCYSNKLTSHYFNKKKLGKIKPIIGTCLSQYELFISMKSLSNHWNEICYTCDIDIYMSVLVYEFCHLLVNPNNERMDGKVQVDKELFTKQEEEERENKKKSSSKYVCTCEYVSNIATIFSYFQRSLIAMNMILFNKNMIFKMNQQESVDFTVLFNENKQQDQSTIVNEQYKKMCKKIIKLVKWLKYENKIQQESKNISDDKKYIFNFYIRSGERELFIRDNNGVEAGEYTSIYDLVRSPSQTNWFFSKLFENGFIKYMDEYIEILKEDKKKKQNTDKSLSEQQQTYVYKLLKDSLIDYILIRIFARYCQNELAFDWWSFCFIHENDFFQGESKIINSKNPMILSIMGHFVVLYKRQVYLYNSSDKAILRWFIIIMTDKADHITHKVTFDTFSNGPFDLTQLNDILETKFLIKHINEMK